MKTRIILRYIHLLAAAVLGTFLYSPWGTEPAFRLAVQAGVFPVLLGATGVAMWQQGRLKRLFRSAPSTGPTARP
ncbi:MAG: hypothetical protein SFX73_26460 [Kofleriaceae bacterium]|nr:hypothetical protein [Kofleriaceae bacterium]